MRLRRRVLFAATTLLVTASTLTVMTLNASAAAAPSAPYTALTMSFQGKGYIDGNFSYEPSRNTLNVYQQTPNGYAISLQGSDATHWHNINVTPPTGSQFVAGTTYSTISSFSPSATDTVVNVSGDGQSCDGTGSLNVLEASYDGGTGQFTAFAATYSVTCGAAVAKGEIRFQSSVDYRATDSPDYRLQFGQQPVGIAGATMDATVAINGVLPTTFGTASLGGTNPSAFSISSDTCSGNTLSYGQTCTLQITATATAIGAQSAVLTLPENSVAGKVSRLLQLDGFDPRDATVSPSVLAFGDIPAYDTSAPLTATLTGAGSLPITFGAAATSGVNASTFTITGDTCSGATLTLGQTCTVTVTAHPTTSAAYINAAVVLPDNSVAGSTSVSLSVNGFDSDKGTYYPVSPSRILDTRIGLGAPKAKVGPGGVVHLQVAGINDGVPLNTVSAVVLNVTVTGPTASSYVSVYPTGVTRPTTSSLNFPAGWTGANSVTVAVGAGGKVDLYNNTGYTHLIADVYGYYSSGSPSNMGYMGGQYHPVVPVRLADTRQWSSSPVPGGYYITVPASFGATVDPHVRAFAVNVTAVSPKSSGYLTAWDGYLYGLPNVSTLNYTTGKTVPNFAVVPTMPCDGCGSATGWPSIGVYTMAATHIIVDIVGYYDDSTVPNGLRFTPNVPTRIADTRIAKGWPAALGAGATATITAPGTLAGADTWALAMNVTAVKPTATTYLTVWPAGISGVGRPTVSNLNPAAGVTVPNAVQTLIGPTNQFNIFNFTGKVDVLADVVGTFYLYPGTATSLATAQPYTSQLQQQDGFSQTSGSPLMRQTR